MSGETAVDNEPCRTRRCRITALMLAAAGVLVGCAPASISSAPAEPASWPLAVYFALAMVLVAGMLVSEPDWGLLCDAMGRPDEATALRQRTVTCAQLLPRPLPREVWAQGLARRLEGAKL